MKRSECSTPFRRKYASTLPPLRSRLLRARNWPTSLCQVEVCTRSSSSSAASVRVSPTPRNWMASAGQSSARRTSFTPSTRKHSMPPAPTWYLPRCAAKPSSCRSINSKTKLSRRWRLAVGLMSLKFSAELLTQRTLAPRPTTPSSTTTAAHGLALRWRAVPAPTTRRSLSLVRRIATTRRMCAVLCTKHCARPRRRQCIPETCACCRYQ
mmetsp:Transcript_18562/g.27197  ORF Transcript_18562/g.27197 Transcript_18562/m.27197 type:complete len:210 (+) Transcript_18562:183-812(+)